MRRIEPDYRPLRAVFLILIPLVMLVCIAVYYGVAQ